MLQNAFGNQTVFGRADIMKVIPVGASRASELLKQLKELEVIVPISGYGKGKYRFREE